MLSSCFPIAAAAAGTGAAALAAIGTADALDTLFLCLVNIARCAPKDQAQQRQKNYIFHKHLPF